MQVANGVASANKILSVKPPGRRVDNSAAGKLQAPRELRRGRSGAPNGSGGVSAFFLRTGLQKARHFWLSTGLANGSGGVSDFFLSTGLQRARHFWLSTGLPNGSEGFRFFLSTGLQKARHFWLSTGLPRSGGVSDFFFEYWSPKGPAFLA